MTTHELADLLKDRVGAAGGKAYPAVHLFGIEFASELVGHDLRELCQVAGLFANYGSEVDKGRRLAPFVELKL